jgi:hypothetical protein
MISIEGVPEAGTAIEPFEASLMVPVPGQEKNTVVLERRDGTNIERLTAKSAEMTRNGKTVFKVSDVKIDVFITDARVALACSKYDKGGGWIGSAGAMIVFNAGSKALAAMRRRGKMMVGQVRYPWIARVGSTAKTGWLSEERLVFDAKVSADTVLRLTLELPKNVDAGRIAAEIARRGAAYRLASEGQLADDERAALRELSVAEPSAAGSDEKKNDIRFFAMPTFWTIGEESARLIPPVGGVPPDQSAAAAATS